MTATKVRFVLFDFMGTCLDWHSGVVAALPHAIPESERSRLALEWRHSYFDENAIRIRDNQALEDIDKTLQRVLDNLLDRHPTHQPLFDERTKIECINAWHSMPAWPDVNQAIEDLQAAGYEVFVVANGTTRLQLDLCRSSGLKFDMLFSSELLGSYKPAPESYQRCMQLIKAKPEECVQVAAHAYDTRGAKQVGMRTVYIHRWTDDVNEDMAVVRGENDCFLEDMVGLVAAVQRL